MHHTQRIVVSGYSKVHRHRIDGSISIVQDCLLKNELPNTKHPMQEIFYVRAITMSRDVYVTLFLHRACHFTIYFRPLYPLSSDSALHHGFFDTF